MDERIGIVLEKAKTDSLIEAIVKVSELSDYLGHLQRASARQILDKLDVVEVEDSERTAIRKRVLDVLAWYRAEVEEWVASQSKEIPEAQDRESVPFVPV